MERLNELWCVYGTEAQWNEFTMIAYDNGISFTRAVYAEDGNDKKELICEQPDTDDLMNITNMYAQLRKDGWKWDKQMSGKVIFRKA